jgi:hypothetical protein
MISACSHLLCMPCVVAEGATGSGICVEVYVQQAFSGAGSDHGLLTAFRWGCVM